MSKGYTSFKEAAPPCDGWYYVIWEPGENPLLRWLLRVGDDIWFSDNGPPEEYEYERWLVYNKPNGWREALALDILKPEEIQWKPK